MAEWAVIIPFTAYATAIILGVDGDSVRLPFLICEGLGILLYMAEIRARFKRHNGRRR